MNRLTIAAFKEHAQKSLPHEAVGFIVAKGDREEFIPLENLHHEPVNNFEIDIRAFKDYDKSALSLVHSHVTGSPNPGRTDKIMCEETGIPWHIYSVEQDSWQTLLPTGFKAPLGGREFIWGVHDCFALVRDYYREKLTITIPNFQRPWKFWEHTDLIARHYESCGFQKVKGLKVHDIITMTIKSSIPCHCAIFVENNLIFHHHPGRLSGVAPYGGMWLKNTSAVYRHESLL
jgi:proteasome lid subunit RPN8/RPN11